MHATKLTLGMLVFTLGYGVYTIRDVDEASADAPTVHVGVVEGDVGIFQVETRPRIRDHLRIQQRLSKTLADKGVDALDEDAHLANGLNVKGGKIVYQAVLDAIGGKPEG